MSTKQPNLFLDDEFEETKITPEKVTCLGMEFPSDEARRAYFREELRKKLPELKKIEGFPIGEDDDIINLSDPPYYTACPNPWLNDFIKEWEKDKVQLQNEGKCKANFEVKEPYASDVSEGKNNPIYTAHPYHTKVPHPAIMRYILHYTQPGDIIFDGFAGTGMTGVAAAACDNDKDEIAQRINKEWEQDFGEKPKWGLRHAICGDLSPYAANISNFYSMPTNIQKLREETLRIKNELIEECGWMYTTTNSKGKPSGKINFVLWSDVLVCPHCGKEYIYWKHGISMVDNRVTALESYPCPFCGSAQSKKTAKPAIETYFDERLNSVQKRIKQVPVIVVGKDGKEKIQREPNSYDFDLLKKIEDTSIPYWFPIDALPDGLKTRDPKAREVYYTHQFFTKRTLIALSAFYKKIEESNYKYELKFMFTSLLNLISKRNRVQARNPYSRGQGVLNLTLVLPPLPTEASLLEMLDMRLNSIIRAKEAVPNKRINCQYTGSADELTIADNSVDYIFTDPPFGANINYSELNSMPEPWLKVITNNTHEAIENEYQGKSSQTYLDTMKRCFMEYYRVLKPGKWMTVEFSNTSASIWNIIQTSLKQSGFVIANVAALDKKQGGMNANMTTTAVKQDLAISCYKPIRDFSSYNGTDAENDIWSFIEEHLGHLPVYKLSGNQVIFLSERDQRILYDRLVSFFVQHGLRVPVDAPDFQKGLRERFIERDGMFFTASQALEYEEKKNKTDGIVPMALFVSSEAEGIEWLKRELKTPQTYADLQPEWMKAMTTTKKGDILPELMDILKENFIEDEDGKWRKPDAERAADLEIIRNRKLMKEFNLYLEQAQKPKAKRMKDTRLEVLRYGFKECYKQKEYQAIVTVGDHIQESLLQEDEVLLQYYDIASSRV
jgi:DNA modification methylase